MTKEMVLFESGDGKVSLPVPMDGNTVWLSQKQMAELFGKDQSVSSRHIKNAVSEGEVDISANYAKFAYSAENVAGSVENVCDRLESRLKNVRDVPLFDLPRIVRELRMARD